jgi:hypothetical protein
LRTRKIERPVIFAFPFVHHYTDDDPYFENEIKVGYKLWKIEFDDLEFDTPNPTLPLWYRILLWWRNNGNS